MRAIVRLLGISPVSFTPVAGSIVIATSIATAQWASSAGRSRAFVHTEGASAYAQNVNFNQIFGTKSRRLNFAWPTNEAPRSGLPRFDTL